MVDLPLVAVVGAKTANSTYIFYLSGGYTAIDDQFKGDKMRDWNYTMKDKHI